MKEAPSGDAFAGLPTPEAVSEAAEDAIREVNESLSLEHDSVAEQVEALESALEKLSQDLKQPLDHYKIQHQKIDVALRQHDLHVEKCLLVARGVFSAILFGLMVAWLYFIGVCVWNVGKGELILKDNVLIALLTSTTINVLGVFIIVANWLFPKGVVSRLGGRIGTD